MEETDPVKRMAELMKAGAVMLAETCPMPGCGLPLFKTKSGEVVCPVHGKIYVVKTEEEAAEVRAKVGLSRTLDRVEERAIAEISEIVEAREAPDPTDLIKWLEVIERVRRIKGMIAERQAPKGA